MRSGCGLRMFDPAPASLLVMHGTPPFLGVLHQSPTGPWIPAPKEPTGMGSAGMGSAGAHRSGRPAPTRLQTSQVR